jgi:hypothetical protein
MQLIQRVVVAVAVSALLSTAMPASASAHGPSSRPGVTTDGLAPMVTAAPGGQVLLGAGARPGLAVDAAGTAYVAWNGPEYPTSLQFCRLPRGAASCGSRHTIAVPEATTSVSRPFVTVSGARVVVVQYRYPTSGPSVRGVYRFTSSDAGVTFGAGELVGSVPFEEGTFGPGDTFSGVPVNGEMSFQNVVLTGAPASITERALLSATHQNLATVGLIDAGRPLAVFTSDVNAQERHYLGSGSINDAANWTPAVDIGVASYPRLAGGPSGLFLLAGNGGTGLSVRKWNGTAFGAPVGIGPGVTPSKHLVQDAAGRLHAVYQRDNANPLQIIHATSDDGVSWRSGTVVIQNIATDGGIEDLRVAIAPDHIGVVVWHAGLGVGDVRIAAVGPDAPVDVSFAGSTPSLRVSNAGAFKYAFVVTAPGSGKISLKSKAKVKLGATKQFIKVPAKAFTAAKAGKVGVRLKLSATALKTLTRLGKLPFKATVVWGGKRYTATLRLKAPR